MKTLKNSDGFSAVHALLILVIIGIVGFTGWYVWRANNESDKNIDNSRASSDSQPSDEDSPQPAKYTSLSSLGVEFIKPATLDDLLMADSVNEVGDKFVAFSSHELKDLEANAYCDNLADTSIAFHLGILFKVDGIYPAEATDENAYGVLIKQLDGYNLQFRKPSDNCFENKDNKTKADAMSKQLIEGLRSSVRER